ncbi:unnamed protein product [Adineta steineri]|uniref:Uncharacterized protein n=1 Tax=Adineta steineri TaxID=433720 RepID=A0A815AXE8_9BILA|nr:unnamed protein product [Adineta steineri]CAF3579362.1 unnamed protein product [Adineta steineri]
MMSRSFHSHNEPRTRSQYASDPYCQLARRKQFDEELEAIRSQSRSIWSKPDTSQTTHGHFFADPEQTQRTLTRPTSAGRKNNPHPKLVFMRTGMREIPNAYGAPPARLPSREQTSNHLPTPAPNYLEEMQDLTSAERHGASAFLKAANEDSKVHVVEAVKNYRILMKNEYECPPIGAAAVRREDGSRSAYYPSMNQYRQALQNDKEFNAVNKAVENSESQLKLTDDQSPQEPVLKRNYRYPNRAPGHFQRRSHSHSHCPWPIARQPFRGDYSIHMDWHPRLPHHRLTCLC